MNTPRRRLIDLNLLLSITRFGQSGLLMATTEQMPNLMVTGTDENDLWDCLPPAITSLLAAIGERVQSLTIDRNDGIDHIRVKAEVQPA